MGERITIHLDTEQREQWRRMFAVLQGKATDNVAPDNVSFDVERRNVSNYEREAMKAINETPWPRQRAEDEIPFSRVSDPTNWNPDSDSGVFNPPETDKAHDDNLRLNAEVREQVDEHDRRWNEDKRNDADEAAALHEWNQLGTASYQAEDAIGEAMRDQVDRMMCDAAHQGDREEWERLSALCNYHDEAVNYFSVAKSLRDIGNVLLSKAEENHKRTERLLSQELRRATGDANHWRERTRIEAGNASYWAAQIEEWKRRHQSLQNAHTALKARYGNVRRALDELIRGAQSAKDKAGG